VEFVLNNLAIKDALVLPVWAREKIVIIPGMEGKLAEYQHALIDTGYASIIYKLSVLTSPPVRMHPSTPPPRSPP
jgi:hypothetical protein